LNVIPYKEVYGTVALASSPFGGAKAPLPSLIQWHWALASSPFGGAKAPLPSLIQWHWSLASYLFGGAKAPLPSLLLLFGR